jgi:hypothetical protein
MRRERVLGGRWGTGPRLRRRGVRGGVVCALVGGFGVDGLAVVGVDLVSGEFGGCFSGGGVVDDFGSCCGGGDEGGGGCVVELSG